MEVTSKKPCRSTSTARSSATLTHLPRLLYSRTEAAFQWSLSVRAVDYGIAAGTIRVRRIGGRIMITRQELLRYAGVDQIEPITSTSSSSLALVQEPAA